MNAGERYQKLPGRLRGVFHGAGVWLGSDHLLSVRSMRIREDYKRFYLRDIQAIVVAQGPRFHLSTRCFGIAAVWLTGFAIAFPRSQSAVVVLWAVALLLIAAWIYISAALSCRCRILTAASSDELPSIYRTWTARRFLDRVAPGIAAVQGVVDAGWAEAAELRLAGPPGETAAGFARKHDDGAGARARTLVSDLFLASLFASAMVTMLMLRAQDARYLVQSLFQLLKVAAAIAVLAQSQRGLLRRGMRRIAATSLVTTGVLYYAQAVYLSFSGGLKASHLHLDVTVGNYLHLYEIGAAISVVLGVAGVIISARADG